MSKLQVKNNETGEFEYETEGDESYLIGLVALKTMLAPDERETVYIDGKQVWPEVTTEPIEVGIDTLAQVHA